MLSRTTGICIVLSLAIYAIALAQTAPPPAGPTPQPVNPVPNPEPIPPGPTTQPVIRSIAPGAQPGMPPAPVPQPAHAASQPSNDPRLSVTPPKFDFGEVWVGAPAKGDITIKNVGEEPLTLKANSSCGCTVPTQPKSPLEPGETTTLSITYNTSHVGVANRNVTLVDAANKVLAFIPVVGTVKPLFVSKPTEHINFQGLTTESEATQTLTLQNNFGKPVNLRLKADQNFGPFDVELKTVEEGMTYELVVKTRPPLEVGPKNRAAVVLETGLAELPVHTINVMAYAQPRVFAVPLSLYMSPATSQPSEQTITIQYRADKPLKITDVHTNSDKIRWERLPDTPPPTAQATYGVHKIKVMLPAFEDVPEGAQVEILTDDDQEQYKKLVVPVVKRSGIPPARIQTPREMISPNSPTTQAAIPTGPQPNGPPAPPAPPAPTPAPAKP